MFSKLFKKKDKEDINNDKIETYAISKMEEDGKVFLLRFRDNILKFAELGKYPFQIGIATSLQTNNNNGLPSKEENEQLLNLEEILMHDFGETALFVGAITGGGMKEFIFYTGDHKKSAKIFEKLRDEVKHHELQCVINNDPEWKIYRTYSQQKN